MTGSWHRRRIYSFSYQKRNKMLQSNPLQHIFSMAEFIQQRVVSASMRLESNRLSNAPEKVAAGLRKTVPTYWPRPRTLCLAAAFGSLLYRLSQATSIFFCTFTMSPNRSIHSHRQHASCRRWPPTTASAGHCSSLFEPAACLAAVRHYLTRREHIHG